MSERNERFIEEIQHAAAAFLNIESSRTSLVTVTNTLVSKDGKRVTILFTVYPEEKEEVVLHFLRRKRSDFKDYLKSHTRLKHLPFVDFDIDRGEKHRQHIDDISRNL